MSRPKPYGLLRCAAQVLTRLSVRGLRLSSLIERQKNSRLFCPLDLLYTSVSVLGLRVWLWRVDLCCVTEDLGIWGIAYGIRLGLFCSAGRASHQLTRSCSAVFSASDSAMRSFPCCNPPPGWLRHKPCDILGLSLQLCFHALFYLL
jgi:hypothetical protein